MSRLRPAWSWGPESGQGQEITASPLLESITWQEAFEGATGRGVRVAIVDSGIDNTHPDVAGAVRGWAEPIIDEAGAVSYNTEPHDDLFGHGTACAGIIHRIAPDAELYSVRVLGAGLAGKSPIFAAGLRWVVDNEIGVANLSLGTTKR